MNDSSNTGHLKNNINLMISPSLCFISCQLSNFSFITSTFYVFPAEQDPGFDTKVNLIEGTG